LIALPEAALFDAGYLQRSCGEPISYQCPEDGGPLAYDGQGQFACSICFKVVEPIVTCIRCKEVLTVKPNHDERVCLSAQAYRNNKGNLLPAFAPTDELIWAFRVLPSSSVQVLTEVALRNKFSNGDLSESTEVSSPQQDTFKLARDTVEFSDALVEGLQRVSQREADARAKRLKEHNLRASDAEFDPVITPPAPSSKGVAYKVFAVLLVIMAIAAVGYAWNAKIEFDKKVAQIELNNQLQKQQDDLARKKLEIERAQKEEALRTQLLADANIRAKEEAAKAAAARTIKEVPSQRQPVETETQQQRSAARGVQLLDGAWYSSEWKYGYVLKNGVGTATSTNSQNFQIGQNIIQLRATSDTTFVGQQVYMDGKFYNVSVTLRPDGHLYFEGDRSVSWVMRRVVDKITVKDKISVKAELYFVLDQTSIPVEGQKLLDHVVSRAATILLDSIVLQGFSASIGSAEDSRNLSLRRAAAVKAYLVSRGIQPGTIYIEGKGAQNPAGDNNTAAGRAMNNRVLIEIIGTLR
jgi:outer membrane protein OmpA-like peptidoglycan-associated protein